MTTIESPNGPSVSDATAADIALLERTMRPYASKDTIYLRRAHVEPRGDSIVGVGEFAITESCYIEDTGHFNAVEFNISYNQLIYYTLAVTIRDRLAPEIANWSLADYWVRQLPSVLISRFESRYVRPIRSSGYSATLTIGDIEFRHRSRPLFALRTRVEFTDPAGGYACGDIEIVLLDPPGQPVADAAR
ncbi:FcoT family thioesterase [Nocardia sp. NBC_01377]|uniref:FcoT family thioesterase n=1 Tax=Nocardia sp. NBC_01377 TaxID=2903595 RepID=UPI003250B402